MVADASRLGCIAYARICPAERMDILATDAATPANKLAAVEAAELEVKVSR